MPETEIKLVNPFCSVNPTMGARCFSNPHVARITGSDYDPETGTITPIIEQIDLQEEINRCKDMAGLDLMKAQLKAGLARPEDFYDDGKSGFDVSSLPASVHEAHAVADETAQKLAQLAKALGLEEGESLTAAQFEKALSAAVARAVAAQTQPAPVGGSTDEQ